MSDAASGRRQRGTPGGANIGNSGSSGKRHLTSASILAPARMWGCHQSRECPILSPTSVKGVADEPGIGRGRVAVALCLASPLCAQSAEQAVKQTNDQLLVAAKAVDKATYAKIAGDDLRWVGSDGLVLSKAQRIAQLQGGSSDRIFRDTDVKVYGTVAVLLCRSDWTANGKKMSERVQRVYVNRGGQWQLVSHSATPLDPTK